MTDEKPPGVNVLEAAYTRWKDMPPVSLTMHRQDLYLILMALQTTTRFPGTTDKMAKHMETIGRQIQEAIVDDAELYAMTDSGWNPDHDVEPDEAPEAEDPVSVFSGMAGAGHMLGIAMQIPDITLELREAMERHDGDHLQAADDRGLRRRWEEAEPETRAALLLNLAWASREHEVPLLLGDMAAVQYASDLHDYAANFEGDSEAFHGVRFPAMPLPGQAGALASSVGFDRDDTDVSLVTVLILMQPLYKDAQS
ncbi:hypothetical protein [Streptomyces ipomoeae]|uniref:hypothetical protein n=1 Tax=Streptomyces ipomoeae TaxID=103232 RepID=UPI0029A73AA7|nr:hypothetical protein [Streptomyces ipomoeae]MDX2695940.1 hypothetical protein [Streptomyces ipomoeae]MDX2843378.1 hypothetical protein [Streptomyces ipomoeae]